MVGELKSSHINILILFCVLLLRLIFYESIPTWHMYYNVKM
jgi:hypothetical protein